MITILYYIDYSFEFLRGMKHIYIDVVVSSTTKTKALNGVPWDYILLGDETNS